MARDQARVPSEKITTLKVVNCGITSYFKTANPPRTNALSECFTEDLHTHASNGAACRFLLLAYPSVEANSTLKCQDFGISTALWGPLGPAS